VLLAPILVLLSIFPFTSNNTPFVFVVVPIPTLPALDTLNTLEVAEFITLNILLALPVAICLIVNVELIVPLLVTSSLLVV